MKRSLTGFDAYRQINEAPVPAKTKTYTPLPHDTMMAHVRSALGANGFRIEKADYYSSNKGDVALGLFTINYQEDPDIQLVAAFLNSYNKEYRFRFGMGSQARVTGAAMFTGSDKSVLFKRKHGGRAEEDAVDAIQRTVGQAGVYWDELIKHKDLLKQTTLQNNQINELLGSFFFDHDVFNSVQMTALKDERTKPTVKLTNTWVGGASDGMVYDLGSNNAWVFYNQVALILKDSHPVDFINQHQIVHDLIINIINPPTTLSASGAVLTTEPGDESTEVEEETEPAESADEVDDENELDADELEQEVDNFWEENTFEEVEEVA